MSHLSALETTDVRFIVVGNMGLITLSRPRACNALSTEMVLSMSRQLNSWQSLPEVQSVAIVSNDERFFSAGGDVRSVALNGEDNPRRGLDFFEHDYALNSQIHHYSKPVVVIVDGIALGAGVGLAAVARHCLVTERAQMAMPETRIGHFTDVGSGWFLNRCPGYLGTWLALTCSRVHGSDAVHARLASAHLSHISIQSFLHDLARTPGPEVAALVDRYTRPARNITLSEQVPLIDAVFWHNRVEDIMAALNAIPGPWTAKWCQAMLEASPTSLKITLAHLRRSEGLALDDVLRHEFNLAARSVMSHDFHRGVRARLVQKKNLPAWSPFNLGEVSDSMVSSYLSWLQPGADILLPARQA
jgi:enoyl-CoA hydratase/carnithine racemase